MSYETCTFGAGCFWCIEAAFSDLNGVLKVTSGYCGGKTKDPDYESVCTGQTGHAEVVQIEYNSEIISFDQLLDAFWQIHDPTQLNRQGNDIGTQYRSVIFYHNEAQLIAAQASIKKYKPSFQQAIVTELSPVDLFYPAENYHQDYFRLNGHNPYCNIVVAPKLKKFRKSFGHMLKSDLS